MYKVLLLTFIALFSIKSLAQSDYLECNYKDVTGKAHFGLVKLFKWKDVPDYFTLKADDNSDSRNINSQDIVELKVENDLLFKRIPVDYDSVYLPEKIKDKIKDGTLLLKVLVEGEMSLYQTGNDNNLTFFFGYKGSKVSQLKYRKYKNKANKELEDLSYKAQIQSVFDCDLLSLEKLMKLEYSEKSLSSLFMELNEFCSDSKQSSRYFTNKVYQSNSFHLRLQTGITSYKMIRPAGKWGPEAMTLDGHGWQAGAELEINIGRKGNWGIISHPTYISVEKKWDISDYFNEIEGCFKYTSFQLPFGLR